MKYPETYSLEDKNAPHYIKNHLNQLIKNNENKKFIEIFNNNEEVLKKADLTKVFIEACLSGNVEVVDFLFSCNLNNLIDFDFPYVEADPPHQQEIKNGAIFLACENHSVELLEYFIRNDLYHIDSDTEHYLNMFMSSGLKIIEKIEAKLYLEDKIKDSAIDKISIKKQKI